MTTPTVWAAIAISVSLSLGHDSGAVGGDPSLDSAITVLKKCDAQFCSDIDPAEHREPTGEDLEPESKLEVVLDLSNLTLKQCDQIAKALNSVPVYGISLRSATDDTLQPFLILPIEKLDLAGSMITDKSLPKIGRKKALTTLDLSGTRITDNGISNLTELDNLAFLYLKETQITERALKHIFKLKDLGSLSVAGTRIATAVPSVFGGMPRLFECDIRGLNVPPEVIDKIRSQMRQSPILWHGSYVPASRQAKAAKSLVSLGMWFRTDAVSLPWFRQTPLRQEFENAHVFDLAYGKESLADEELAAMWPHIQDLSDVRGLFINSERISNRSLMTIVTLDGLEELHLTDCTINDDGVDQLIAMKELKVLSLVDVPITDRCLASIKQLHNLKALSLEKTGVSDQGLEQIASMKNLITLNLANTEVTDAGLHRLKELKLQRLDLSGTTVSDVGVRELVTMSSLTTLNLRDTRITEAGSELSN